MIGIEGGFVKRCAGAIGGVRGMLLTDQPGLVMLINIQNSVIC